MKEFLEEILIANRKAGGYLRQPATAEMIRDFEKQMNIILPDDLREFYLICDGFECNNDIFNLVSLENILSNRQYYKGIGQFDFAEYMIYSGTWDIRIHPTLQYDILSETEVILTNDLKEFFQHFLKGGVFESGGLYDWEEELRNKK